MKLFLNFSFLTHHTHSPFWSCFIIGSVCLKLYCGVIDSSLPGSNKTYKTIWFFFHLHLQPIHPSIWHLIWHFSFLLLFFCLFRAAPMAFGSSQARSQIRAATTSLHHSHQIWAESATYTIAHGNTRSLTHWVGPGIKPASSWMLVRFVSAEPQRKLLIWQFSDVISCISSFLHHR